MPTCCIDAAATRLGVCRKTVYNLIHRGRLRAVRRAARKQGLRVTLESVNRERVRRQAVLW